MFGLFLFGGSNSVPERQVKIYTDTLDSAMYRATEIGCNVKRVSEGVREEGGG